MAGKKEKEGANSLRAKPVRALLQTLVRAQVKTRAEKEKLAEFLGQAVSSVDAMIYYGEGGLDSWISALIYCYDLQPDAFSNFVHSYRDQLKKMKPIKESDRLWSEIDLSEDEKVYWANLISASATIQKDLRRHKRRKTMS